MLEYWNVAFPIVAFPAIIGRNPPQMGPIKKESDLQPQLLD
jgi:hypothetical protein